MRQFIDILNEGYDHTSNSWDVDMRGTKPEPNNTPERKSRAFSDSTAPKGLEDHLRANTPEKQEAKRKEAQDSVAKKRAARAPLKEGFIKDFLASYALSMLGVDNKVKMSFQNGEKRSLDVQDAKVVAKHLIQSGAAPKSPAELWQAISGGQEGIGMRMATLRQALEG